MLICHPPSFCVWVFARTHMCSPQMTSSSWLRLWRKSSCRKLLKCLRKKLLCFHQLLKARTRANSQQLGLQVLHTLHWTTTVWFCLFLLRTCVDSAVKFSSKRILSIRQWVTRRSLRPRPHPPTHLLLPPIRLSSRQRQHLSRPHPPYQPHNLQQLWCRLLSLWWRWWKLAVTFLSLSFICPAFSHACLSSCLSGWK